MYKFIIIINTLMKVLLFIFFIQKEKEKKRIVPLK